MSAFRRYVYRHLHHLLPLPILLAAFLAWFTEAGQLVQFRQTVFDEYLRLKPRQYEPTPVRIVDIDEDSLQRFGQWPWPRTLLAKLVDRLNELGAAAIAFDILFIDADRTTRWSRGSTPCPTTIGSSPRRSRMAASCSASRCATRTAASFPM